ncbi:hypothetical protein [Arthrobacter sp. ISL-28]|nr:hypothetical protein [Arthrobacter sp. ISL-28]
MYRKIYSTAVLLATALGFAAVTASPATAGAAFNHCEPLVRR